MCNVCKDTHAVCTQYAHSIHDIACSSSGKHPINKQLNKSITYKYICSMDPIEKLLFEAQTIANIPKGARINTSGEFINIEHSQVGQSLWRALNRDSRERSVMVVFNTMQMIITLSDLMLESRFLLSDEHSRIEREKRILTIKRMHIALAEACGGIDSLCETYSDDSNVIAKLKPLMIAIDGQVAKLSKYLMEIGEYNDPRSNKLYLNILSV